MAEYTLTPTQSEQIRTVSELRETDPETVLERGACPWCEDYTGDYPGQHASSAHPDEWEAYRDG